MELYYNRVTLAKKGVLSITTAVAEALGLWWMERTTVQGTGLESCLFPVSQKHFKFFFLWASGTVCDDTPRAKFLVLMNRVRKIDVVVSCATPLNFRRVW